MSSIPSRDREGNGEYGIARSHDGVNGLIGTLVAKNPDRAGRYRVLIHSDRTRNIPGEAAPDYGWNISKVDRLPVKSISAFGDRRPPAGTRVVGFTTLGTVVPGYSTSNAETSGRIVISESPGAYHGTLCARWVELPDDAETALIPHGGRVADHRTLTSETRNDSPKELSVLSRLTDDEKRDVSRAALDTAKRLGYCSETKNVLKALGLPEVLNRKVFTVEVEVEWEDGIRTPEIGRLIMGNNRGEASPNYKVKVTDKTEVDESPF